jgi:osmoprotectant transport system substrate-binding protein
MHKLRNRLGIVLVLLGVACSLCACKREQKAEIVVGSKFFTEQVVLAELLAQHVEARTGIAVERKTNLGGTLLVQKALLAGQLDMYVEYTGTALTAVLNEPLEAASARTTRENYSHAVYERVKKGYGEKFKLDVGEPLGFENTFAMVIRGDDAKTLHLRTVTDLERVAPQWRIGVGYEFLERPDGFPGWSQRYGLHFAEKPKVMDLGLVYRSLLQHQVDVVAGNSTDGLIDTLHLVALEDNLHYFPPYDAVPVVREETMQRYPALRAAIAELAGKISANDMRKMNYAVDAELKDPKVVVQEFRNSRGL